MQITIGTISLTNGSPVVISTESFDESPWSEITEGALLILGNDRTPRYIASKEPPSTSVSGFWELTLSANYTGTTVSGVSYSITLDFTENYNLPLVHEGDVDAASLFSRAMTLIDSSLRDQADALEGYVPTIPAHGLFYVSDYGAVGNGVVNDTAAINTAITACRNAGGGTVVFDPGKEYLLMRRDGTNGPAILLYAGVSLDGRGCSLVLGENATFIGNKLPDVSALIANDVVAGDNVIHVSGGTTFVPGDIIGIQYGADEFDAEVPRSWFFAKVTSFTSNQAYLDTVFPEALLVDEVFDSCKTIFRYQIGRAHV